MGDTIWVDVQGRAEDDLPPDCSIVLRLEKQLENLSEKLGVTRLTDFYDFSALQEEFSDATEGEDADGDTRVGDSGPEGTWFEPAPALAPVRAIHDHLARHPEDLRFKPDASRAHWPADLMEELAHCRRVLEEAMSSGRRFRFLIVS